MRDHPKKLEGELPQEDAAQLSAHARPFVYHWIGTLQALGTVDHTVTADVPTAVTFTRAGKRTHVAYNSSARTVTVRFSDGVTLRVQPGHFATR